MTTYRGGETPLQDSAEEHLGSSAMDRRDRPTAEEVASFEEAGSDAERRPGQKGYSPEDKQVGDGPEGWHSRDLEDRLRNLKSADERLKMTEQERELYMHHLQNLWNEHGYTHDDGSVSTLFATTVGGDDGKTFLIPTIHEGAIIDPREAEDIARMRGLDKYPSYSSPEEAKARYDKIHDYMDRDVVDHRVSEWQRKQQSSPDARAEPPPTPRGLMDQ